MARSRWCLFLECLDFYKRVLLTLSVLSLMKDAAIGQERTSTSKLEISPSFVDTRRDIKVLQSGMAILPCSVRNLGDKEVVWRRVKADAFLTIGAMVWTKDHRVIVDYYMDDEGTTAWDLIIKNTQFSDTGIYECQIASLEYLTRNVELEILEKPTTDFKSTVLQPTTLVPTKGTDLASADHKYIQLLSGKPIRLTCNTSLGNTSLPTSSLEWFKDGQEIHSSRVVFTRYQFETDRMYVSELIIDSSIVSDTGEYKCRLGNDVLYAFKILVLPKTKSRSRKDHANAHYFANVNVLNSEENSKSDTGSGMAPSGNNVFICLAAFVCLLWRYSSHFRM